MSMANPLLSVFRGQQTLSAYSMPPRAHQQMDQILTDTLMPSRGAPAHAAFQQALHAGDPSVHVTDFVEKLWNAECNQDLVQEFMKIPLCFDAAHGVPEALAAYKKYAAQDFFYLANWITYKVLRELTGPVNNSVGARANYASSVHRASQHALNWLDTCENKIGIEMKDQIANSAVLEYTSYLDTVARSDNWFSLHVVLIACHYGWSKLALSLYRKNMDDTTDFYKYWLKDSLDLTDKDKPALSSYAVAISKFLNVNAVRYASRLQEEDTNKLFRAGLVLEIGLFNSVYKRDAP